MKTVWVFGDSFSNKWEDVESLTLRQYVKEYSPSMHFSNVVKESLGFDKIKNFSKAGFCNYSILESIGNQIESIDPSDCVLVGWSNINRWRTLSYLDDNWLCINPSFITSRSSKELSPELLNECVNRESIKSVEEVNSWLSILNYALPKNTVHWTPFQEQVHKWELNLHTPNFKLKRINKYTPIKDTHLIEEAHIDIGKWLIDLLRNNKQNSLI